MNEENNKGLELKESELENIAGGRGLIDAIAEGKCPFCMTPYHEYNFNFDVPCKGTDCGAIITRRRYVIYATKDGESRDCLDVVWKEW